MKNRIVVLAVSILFITNMCTCLLNSIQANETTIIWSCTIHVNESEGKQDTVVFGEAPDASDGQDSYDIPAPPIPPQLPVIKAWFETPFPVPFNNLFYEYKHYPTTNSVWNLTLQWMPSGGSSPTTITMSWLTSEIDDSEYTSVDLCTDTGTILQNMLIDTTYTFSCPAYVPQNFKIICAHTDNPPETPNIPSGETTGYHGTSYTYSTSFTDPEGDDLYYQFDWGNTIQSSWLGPSQSGEIISTSYIWETPGTYQIKAKAKDIYGMESNWSPACSVEMTNRAPNQPATPSPQHETTQVSIDPVLRWTGNDPDGDTVTYDVFFGTNMSPAKIVIQQSNSYFTPETLDYQTTYYWKIVSWDTFGANNTGALWSFTTEPSDGTSDGTNGGTSEENKHPVANASASEQNGFVGTLLIFNGSLSVDPDGYLTQWSWDFGDNTNRSGETTTHSYQHMGTYTVTLTVTDNKNATDNDTVRVLITTAHKPPTTPIINGTRTGTKNTMYTYTIQSTDPENAPLQYNINWGDETQNTSTFLPNGTLYSLRHTWNAPGKYIISATATDNTILSEHATFPIFIDVYFVGELGYLLDNTNDGLYDSFYTNITGIVTNVQKLTNGSYLLDTDSDGKWNYLYNPSRSFLTVMSDTEAVAKDQWMFIFIIGLALIAIASIVYFYKKKYF
jgi:PKD repeat protein